MKKLEVIRAGAGSGKTTELCRIVAEAVSRDANPSRILATTFTKKAAAELKSRMQAKLLRIDSTAGRTNFELADLLDLAAIGTVHSVAGKLLSRYSMEMGLSPILEVLDESGSTKALNDLVGQLQEENWVRLSESAMRLNVDGLQRRILKLLEIKRGNLINDELFRSQMRSSADRLCQLLGTPSSTVDTDAGARLLKLAEIALQEVTSLNDTQKNTETALHELRQLLSQGNPGWGSFVEAQKIKAGKSTGANAKLNALRAYAAQVRANPGLHDDIRNFSALLAEETIRLKEHYQAFKKERGFVDYIDLEILLLELLSNAHIRSQVQHDYDLVLVDEFQDTNPLQLAIFQSLRSLMPQNFWVGDPKQAIYSFRDTDPELVNRIWNQKSDIACRELTKNYRSQKGIVQFVGRAFESSLGKEAIQSPTKEGLPRGLERWILAAKNNEEKACTIALGIAKLREEGLRLGDIAILERTNVALAEIASALEQVGVPYLLESPGLFSTREGRLVLSGLRLVADRNDALAAATILHLLSDPDADTPAWFQERLEELQIAQKPEGSSNSGSNVRQFPWHSNSTLSQLETLDQEILPPSVLVHQVIEMLDLPGIIRKWSEPVRRSAQLDSIVKHARDYEDVSLKSGEAATLTGLILYLEGLAQNGMDYRHPPLGHDAVTLITYHGAKGLEWPTVILCGLNSVRDPDVWLPVAYGGNQSSNNPLEGRMLRYWIWPFGCDRSQYARPIKGSGLEDDALASDEGMLAQTKAIEESVRLLYVGCTRAKEKLVFAHRPKKYDWLKQIAGIDVLLDPTLDDGEYPLTDIETTYVVRNLQTAVAAVSSNDLTVSRWLADKKTQPTRYEKRFHSPSSVLPEVEASFRIEELSGPPVFPSGAREEDYAAIGNATHAYLGSLPSIRSLSEPQRIGVAERGISGFGVTGKITPQMLVRSGDQFCAWVSEKFPGATWLTEVPVCGLRAAGGKWRGTIDLLLVLPDGRLVVIDHKSAPIRREHCQKKAISYSGQIHAYEEALISLGESVELCFIHFPFAATVVEVSTSSRASG